MLLKWAVDFFYFRSFNSNTNKQNFKNKTEQKIFLSCLSSLVILNSLHAVPSSVPAGPLSCSKRLRPWLRRSNTDIQMRKIREKCKLDKSVETYRPEKFVRAPTHAPPCVFTHPFIHSTHTHSSTELPLTCTHPRVNQPTVA